MEAIKLYIVNLWCNNQENFSDGVGSPSEESLLIWNWCHFRSEGHYLLHICKKLTVGLIHQSYLVTH